MAERMRSKDGHRETEDLFGAEGEISHQGRAGGDPAKKVATRDEEKRATERPASATRVTKSDEKEDGQ
ncbi:MAG: hypothetical protein CL812_02235 [Confluentimicrobium sp.]|nr:hypothetical protein [Actibacterium sp.]|tara:strand:+ start:446 stop:649 length:204 start_codon:yes stop_codon:yes gene_type:complete